MNIKDIIDQIKNPIDKQDVPRSSIWELTSDYSLPQPPTDELASTPIHEIEFDSASFVVDEATFSAWTGRRFVNGKEHHGPVYNMGTSILYTGPRQCPCTRCSSSVSPHLRYN
jgi:hypothetical protein